MLSFRPVKCQSCGMPLPSGAIACHYCRTTVSIPKLWKVGSWVVAVTLTVVLVSAFGSGESIRFRIFQTLYGIWN